MIDIYCTLTEAEYLEAQQMFQQEQSRKWRWWKWPLCTLFLSSAIVILLHLPRPIAFGDVPPYTFSLVVLGIFPLWVPLLQRRAFKKRYEKEKANLTDAHIMIDQSGYRCDVPGIGSGIAEWSGMSSWREGKSVFMIRSGYLMRVIPKNALSREQVNEVRQILSTLIA